MLKRLVGWLSLLALLLLLLGGCTGSPAAPPPAPASASPAPEVHVQLAPQSRPLLGAGQLPEREQPQPLKTRKAPPPPPRPRPTPLKVTPPPAPPPPAAPESSPQLPGAAYPQAGGVSLNPVAPPVPVGLGPRDYLARAESASQQLDQLIRRGSLRAEFIGTGHAGDMVEMSLHNNTGRTISVHLAPGMMLRPGDGQKVQPLMVNEDTTITLAPGASSIRALPSFCMDSRVPAPAPDGLTAYRFATRTKDGGPATVRVLQVAQQIALQPSSLPESYHRQAVTQLALWKSMRQPVGEVQMQSAMGPAYYDLATRRAILADVERVLAASR
ncbi:MAG: hypothetical protein KF760_15085 [Candidatus Eremiobacteraeota bacterium]|nr:hypothetical protein [Candidatus Eremiobacteraeota bacterium]MCW5866364.1 hypothetical protein [Candidatus Eremiobacteraeota bacterium]